MTKAIRLKAMDLLARREHSFQELVKKLSVHFDDSPLINDVLEKLQQQGLQSDQRFAEMFVRSRVNKTHGPIRIKNELRQRGVSVNLVNDALRQEGVDWMVLIEGLSIKKYGNTLPVDDRDRARRIRFFQYRGFSLDQINTVMSYTQEL